MDELTTTVNSLIQRLADVTAEHAWPSLVRAEMLNGVSLMLFFSSLVVVTLLSGKGLAKKMADDNCKEEAAFCQYFSYVVSAMLFGGVVSQLPRLLEPQGALIRSMLP